MIFDYHVALCFHGLKEATKLTYVVRRAKELGISIIVYCVTVFVVGTTSTNSSFARRLCVYGSLDELTFMARMDN